MKIKEVAELLGVSKRTLQYKIKKIYPELVNKGKATEISQKMLYKVIKQEGIKSKTKKVQLEGNKIIVKEKNFAKNNPNFCEVRLTEGNKYKQSQSYDKVKSL